MLCRELSASISMSKEKRQQLAAQHEQNEITITSLKQVRNGFENQNSRSGTLTGVLLLGDGHPTARGRVSKCEESLQFLESIVHCGHESSSLSILER